MNSKDKLYKTKDEYWQCVRGICIIFVVLIHCKNGIQYRNQFNNSLNFDYWLIMRQFINFPVAIFIFLSGYFVNIEGIKKSYVTYIYKRVARLLVPFLMWSAFYTIIKHVTTKENINIIKKLVKFLLGLSSGQLYFILVLLQLTILTPLLIKIIQSNKGMKLCFLITPVYLLILYSYIIIYKKQMPFYQTFFPAWFVFYYIGLLVKIRGYKSIFKKNEILNSILCCSITLIFSIIEGYGLLALGFSEGFVSSQIKISSFLYVFSLINLLMVIKPHIKIQKIRWIKHIGDNSYGIYYVHMLWIIFSNKILALIHVTENILPIYQFIQLIFTIIFSCFSIYIVERVIGKSFSSKLLGF